MAKTRAYLVGPFVGDLFWECYRFAPYIIHLKKSKPKHKVVVFTRPQSFDLYGKYADVFVPLLLRKENLYTKDCFKLRGLCSDDYKYLNSFFERKYKRKYDFIERIIPDIDSWRYKVKWQFPRDKMDYDFIPRTKNKKILKRKLKLNNIIFIDLDDEEILGIDMSDHKEFKFISNSWVSDFSSVYGKDMGSSNVGFLIELIKKSKFVIGRGDRFSSRLSLLLGTPLICLNDETDNDTYNLINPLNTPIIKCEDLSDGMSAYENNF